MAVQLKSLVGLSLPELQTLKASCLNTINEGVLPIGQSYTIGERNYQLANLNDVTQLLMAANYAIRLASRSPLSNNRIFPNFGPRQGWRFGGWGPY